MFDRATMILKLALRNVVLQRSRALVVGSIFFFSNAFTVTGHALVDTMDGGMARSIVESMAGHLQIYSKDAKDDLAIYGDEFMGMPDFGVMPNFGAVAQVIRSVDGIKAVVPMGSRIAFVDGGNELDRRLRELRAAEKNGQAEPLLKQHIRQMIGLLEDDLTQALTVAADDSDVHAQIADVKRGKSDTFWAEYTSKPFESLEFLENKVAPLQTQSNLLALWFVGTDLTQFQQQFQRFEIVLGQAVPEGERGFLFSHGFYEKMVKHKVARALDALLKAHQDGDAIDTDPNWVSKRSTLIAQYRRVLFQLGPNESKKLAKWLSEYLGQPGELADLVQTFLAVSAANIEDRHAVFYAKIAPFLELYSVPVGGELTIRSMSRTGYARAANVKVFGTFRFKGLDGATIAEQHNLIDLMSFRELFGFMTPERKAEIEKIRAKVGVKDVTREDAEDALFGGDAEIETTATAQAIDEIRIERETTMAQSFTPDDIQNGMALHAAIILQDGSPESVISHQKTIQDALDAAELGVKVVTWQQASGMIGQFTVMVRVVLLVISFILAIVALVIVNNSMVMATMERVREIGTMRAIGAQRGFVTRLLLAETLILALFAGGLGVLLGAVMVWGLNSVGIPSTNEFTQFLYSGDALRPVLRGSHLIMAMINVLLIGLFATWYPARIASKIPPIEAMGAGG